jgi:hypothetical protein
MALTPENYWTLGSTIQKTFTNLNVGSGYEHFGFMSVNPIDGHLVMVYRKGTAYVGSIGSIYIRHSRDGGANWSNEELLLSEANVDLRNIAGGYVSSGRLFLFYIRYNYQAQSPCLSMNYRYSDDDGQNWSNEHTLSNMSQSGFSPHGHIIDVGNNVFYQTWYASTGSTYKLFLYKTINGNNNPPSFSVIEIYSGTTQYTETSMINIGGGCFILLARNNGSWYFHQFKSENNCQNWTSQGDTSFETLSEEKSPPWLSFINYEGIGIVACYYTNRGTRKLNVVYGIAKDLLENGPSAWNVNTKKEILNYGGTKNCGYQSFFQPLNQYKAIGVGFKENDDGSAYPIIVFSNIHDINNTFIQLGL